MLIQLYGRNFRSFRDEFRLSMVACDFKNEEESNRGTMSLYIEGFDEPLKLLRCAAIFGANGSGKSNLLRAASALNWLATKSSRESRPDGSIPPYEPFLLDAMTSESPVILGCDLVHDHLVLRYELEFDRQRIRREQLKTLGKTETLLIDRVNDEPITGELITKSDANRLYVQDMQAHVTVLSKLHHLGSSSKGKFSVFSYHDSIAKAMSHRDYSRSFPNPFAGAKRFNNNEYKRWVLNHLIKPSDVGIVDIIVEEAPPEIARFFHSVSSVGIQDVVNKISFVHTSPNSGSIDFDDESFGTRKMLAMSDSWWRLAHEPVSIFADEVSAGLHPKLLAHIVRAVNEPNNANHHSQLIFTTHDTGLMDRFDTLPPALRRDQIFFTKKDSTGSSQLYSLPEFKDEARTVHNIRKRYLSGVYGAIPMPEDVSL